MLRARAVELGARLIEIGVRLFERRHFARCGDGFVGIGAGRRRHARLVIGGLELNRTKQTTLFVSGGLLFTFGIVVRIASAQTLFFEAGEYGHDDNPSLSAFL